MIVFVLFSEIRTIFFFNLKYICVCDYTDPDANFLSWCIYMQRSSKIKPESRTEEEKVKRKREKGRRGGTHIYLSTEDIHLVAIQAGEKASLCLKILKGL